MTRWSITDEPLRERMAAAVADDVLGDRVARAVDRFATHRSAGLAELHDADGLRRAARAVRASVLADLAGVAERFAVAVEGAGGHVHWAADAAGAARHVLDVCRRHGAQTVVKSKSMVTEEIGLNDVLEGAGLGVTETDLGEWIIQLAREVPSHIIAPAIHHDRRTIAALFAADGRTETTDEPTDLNAYARARLRERFLAADVGISGGNLGVAATGSVVLVSNEGNARMCTSLPRVHVAVVGIERLVETWDQADLLLTLLTRSATGQRLSSYVSVLTGPGEGGPDELHVVLLDGGRSDLLGTELQEALACIRCGACLNACPVYRQTGGHAYGWVYQGPIGAVLTPSLAAGIGDAEDVPRASTLCGACMDACPVEIPLQDLLLVQRRRRAENLPSRSAEALAWRAWAAAWSRPAGYAATTTAAGWARFAGDRVLAGRALPAPATGGRFRDRWARSKRGGR